MSKTPLALSTNCGLLSPVLGAEPDADLDGSETRFECERRTGHSGAHRLTLEWSPDPMLTPWEGTA